MRSEWRGEGRWTSKRSLRSGCVEYGVEKQLILKKELEIEQRRESGEKERIRKSDQWSKRNIGKK